MLPFYSWRNRWRAVKPPAPCGSARTGICFCPASKSVLITQGQASAAWELGVTPVSLSPSALLNVISSLSGLLIFPSWAL